jgi:uncharacterized damage-inducible protein DinB
MHAYFANFARYNAWANARLYDAAACLTEAQFREDLGAFFRSVQGTLNHLLVTDRIWMQRMTGTGAAPYRLDEILFEELAPLRTAREAEDDRIVEYVTGLSESDLAGSISYRRVSTPELFAQPIISVLAHFFNHQTHHRGQVHTLLTSLTGQAPELDLLFFQRQEGWALK